MSTSLPTILSKPVAADQIPSGTLGYLRARNRYEVHDLVLTAFDEGNLSQADLARRMNRAPEVVSRLLSAPSNMTLDTLSDMLFAISGAVPTYGVAYPLDAAPRNYVAPDWLSPQFVANVNITTTTTPSTAYNASGSAMGGAHQSTVLVDASRGTNVHVSISTTDGLK